MFPLWFKCLNESVSALPMHIIYPSIDGWATVKRLHALMRVTRQLIESSKWDLNGECESKVSCDELAFFICCWWPASMINNGVRLFLFSRYTQNTTINAQVRGGNWFQLFVCTWPFQLSGTDVRHYTLAIVGVQQTSRTSMNGRITAAHWTFWRSLQNNVGSVPVLQKHFNCGDCGMHDPIIVARQLLCISKNV